MRLRNIETAAPAPISNIDFVSANNELCLVYHIKTMTPLFGGGVTPGEPDKKMPVRATAIRGQLRYWWRFIKRYQHGAPEIVHTDLLAAEREIWGGMAETGEDFASKVMLRIVQSRKDSVPYGNQVAYALFPARSENDKPAKKIIIEGIEFQLIVTLPPELVEEVKETIRWWMTFGGIGARTRRGVGSIEIIKLIQNNQEIQVKPISKDEAEACQCQLVFGESDYSDPIRAWENAVGKLQNFRQSSEPEGIGRKAGPGRSNWPEPDSIREICQQHSSHHQPDHLARISFPRAFFGLPITFKFKDDRENPADPAESQLQPAHSERMASPLILTAYQNSDKKYEAAALLLPYYRDIQQISLQLKRGNNDIPEISNNLPANKLSEWREKHWDNWQVEWWDEVKARHVKPINAYSNNGTDNNPLNAFLNYFQGLEND